MLQRLHRAPAKDGESDPGACDVRRAREISALLPSSISTPTQSTNCRRIADPGRGAASLDAALHVYDVGKQHL